jgi:hypothetical protein
VVTFPLTVILEPKGFADFLVIFLLPYDHTVRFTYAYLKTTLEAIAAGLHPPASINSCPGTLTKSPKTVYGDHLKSGHDLALLATGRSERTCARLWQTF